MSTLVTLLLMAGGIYALWIAVDFASAMVEFDETRPPCEYRPAPTPPDAATSSDASESCQHVGAA